MRCLITNLQLAGFTYKTMGTSRTLDADYFFMGGGIPHGTSSAQGEWSQETIEALNTLVGLMECDLRTKHFEQEEKERENANRQGESSQF